MSVPVPSSIVRARLESMTSRSMTWTGRYFGSVNASDTGMPNGTGMPARRTQTSFAQTMTSPAPAMRHRAAWYI